MVLFDNLPTDSVLHRHAVTERLRALGLPPTDAVLRRHHAQLVDTLQTRAAAALAATRAASKAAAAKAALSLARSAAAAPATAAPATAAPASSGGGGLFGWLRRLLGAS